MKAYALAAAGCWLERQSRQLDFHQVMASRVQQYENLVGKLFLTRFQCAITHSLLLSLSPSLPLSSHSLLPSFLPLPQRDAEGAEAGGERLHWRRV